MNDRKTNANAWYAELSEEEQQRAYETLRALGYMKGRLVLQGEFGLSPSLGAMSAFYQKMAAKDAEANLLRAAIDIEQIEAMTESVGQIDEVLRNKLNHAALAALVGGDPEQIKLLVKLALDARSADREDAKLKQRIVEAEAKLAAAGKAVGDSKLTPEEKEMRIREALGL
jgi:hypothetical protein